MDKLLQKINDTRANVVSLGRKVYIFFTVLFAAFCAIAVVFFIFSLLSAFRPGEVDSLVSPMGVIGTVSMLLSLSITGISIFVMRSVFKDIATERSPFSLTHAKQIKIIAWLFVADAIMGMALSPGFLNVLSPGGSFDVGYLVIGDYRSSVIPIDVRGIVGAVFCFALSLIWRYGSLLQREEDDLM